MEKKKLSQKIAFNFRHFTIFLLRDLISLYEKPISTPRWFSRQIHGLDYKLQISMSYVICHQFTTSQTI